MAIKVIEDENAEYEEKWKQMNDDIDNPISEYFANEHPEVLKNAMERHYLTDRIWTQNANNNNLIKFIYLRKPLVYPTL